MNLKKLLFLPLLFFVLRSNAAALETAQQVLDNLYQTNGNFIFQKPTLRITDDTENAALFMRRSNRIEVSTKAMKVCRSFGRDSLDALAFLIGHELAHSYKSELLSSRTSFLAYDKSYHSSSKIEEDADLHGLFMTYLSGYKTIDLVGEIIERIYSEFELKNKVLKNYPTFEERQKSTEKVVIIADELIKIFEAGNHLTAIGQYRLAGACFEHVEQYYNGREVYNNLGICYALAALNFSEMNSEGFVFPFEITWSTRFKKPKGQRGGSDLTAEDQLLRKDFLSKAEENFRIASEMDADFLTTKLNLFSTLILQGETGAAIDFYKKNQLAKTTDNSKKTTLKKEKIRLAFALAVYEVEKIAAERIWKNLSKSKNYFIARQAMHNLKMARGIQPIIDLEKENCGALTSLNRTVDGVKLHRPSGQNFKSLAGTKELEFSIIKKAGSLVYFFKNQGKTIFSLQRILSEPEIDILATDSEFFTEKGIIAVCESNRISVVAEDDKSIKEWAKYFGNGL